MKFIYVMILALLAGCAADVSQTNEPLETEHLAGLSPYEGQMVTVYPNAPHQSSGFRLWRKCPAYRGPGTNYWYSKSIHPNALVLDAYASYQYLSHNGYSLKWPWHNTLHGVHTISTPYQAWDYFKDEGQKRLFLLEYPSDPSGSVETAACVWVDRDDADSYSNAIPAQPIVLPNNLVYVPYIDEQRTDEACPSPVPPSWPDGLGDMSYNPTTDSHFLVRYHAVYREAGTLTEDTRWYSNKVSSSVACRKYVFATAPLYNNCSTFKVNTQTAFRPAQVWVRDYYKDGVTNTGHYRLYMGKGKLRPNSVMWSGCGTPG